MIEIVTALSGLKTASELATRLRDALKSPEIKPDEVVARIMEIQGLITDGRTAVINLQEHLTTKNAEIQALKDRLREIEQNDELKKSVVFHDHACWRQYEVETSQPHGVDEGRARGSK